MYPVTVQRIEELCEESNITMTFLEMSIGISKGSIRTWRRIKPSVDKVIKVAEYFSVSSDYLLGLSDSRYSSEDEESDIGLVSLKRARSKMTDSEKERMDQIIRLSFYKLFQEDKNDNN